MSADPKDTEPSDGHERSGQVVAGEQINLATVHIFAIRGQIEQVTDGVLQGWAVKNSNQDDPVALDIYIDGSLVGTVEASNFRPELQEVGLRDGYCAFYYKIPKRFADGKQHDAFVQETGSRKQVGARFLFSMAPYLIREIKGNIDLINVNSIVGWAVDIDNPEDPLELELLADGAPIAKFKANHFREDLKLAGLRDGRFGFFIATPPALLSGKEHHVSISVINTSFVLDGAKNFSGTVVRPYRNFQEYLSWAFIYQEIHEPFNENDRCIIADMIMLAKRYEYATKATTYTDLISIIMPTYNRAGLIRDAISSIVAQTYSHWELLIVDDAGTDNTGLVVEAYNDSRIKYTRISENGGAGPARDVALRQCSGKYVAYLDSDNKWDPRYLEIMLYELRASKASSAYCAQYVTYVSPVDLQEQHAIRFSPFNRSALENCNYIDLNCFIHDIKLYSRSGGFARNLRMLEDWEFILRYTADESPVAVPCLLSFYRLGHAQSHVTIEGDFNSATTQTLETVARSPLDIHKWDLADKALRVELSSKLFNPAKKGDSGEFARFTSIIIPSFEAGAYLDLCLESVRRFTDEKCYEIIIIDNASSGLALEVLRKHGKHGNIKIIYNKLNLGFSAAVNQGIEAARLGADIVLLNNDACVTEGWLDAIWLVRERVPEAGIIAPRQVLLPHAETIEQHCPMANPSVEVDVTLSAHHSNVVDPIFLPEFGLVELSFAPFFCVYICRDVIETVGPLDERNGRHYRSDVTYCDMVRYIGGRKIIYTPHSKIYHFLQRSTAELKSIQPKLYNEMFERNTWERTDGVLDNLFE
jgi:O-antigen biosynthesis protein